MYGSCTNDAIQSHILQKKGVISHICEDGHYYVLDIENLYNITNPSQFLKFSKIGINKGLTHPLFCGDHDTSLFRSIEQSQYDPSNYRSQLLFCYRGSAMEQRKKEILADIHGGMLNSQIFRAEAIDAIIESTTLRLTGYMMGVEDLRYFNEEFQKDIENPDRARFHFTTRQLHRLDICTSATFSPIDEKLTDAEQLKALNAIFTAVFPFQNSTVVVSGYHKDHYNRWMTDYVDSWSTLSKHELEMRISNLLIKRCETWGASPHLYRSLSKAKKDTILKQFIQDVSNLDQSLSTSTNVFSEFNPGN